MSEADLDLPAPITVCGRCGGFKPLVENRWRTLCAECQALVAHPIETLPLTSENLIRATGRLWFDNALWMLPLAIVGAVPLVVLRWLVLKDAVLLEMACTFANTTLIECCLLLILAKRTFSWTAAPIFTVLRRRYLTVLLVNIVVGFAASFGLIGCVVGTFFVANLLQLAVPLALFDERSAAGATAHSSTLSVPHYWVLFPGTLLFSAPSMLGGLSFVVADAAAKVLPQYETLFATLRVLAPMIERALNTLPQVFELVLWSFLVFQPSQASARPLGEAVDETAELRATTPVQ